MLKNSRDMLLERLIHPKSLKIMMATDRSIAGASKKRTLFPFIVFFLNLLACC
jgi:hypothetical protein